jgi:hypothetical protein
VDETTKFCWPRRVHPDVSPACKAFIERMWFQIGVVIGLAVYNNQWVALGQPLPPHIFFAMLKREAVAYEDMSVAWPLLAKRLEDLASATPEQWAAMELAHSVSGDALTVRPEFEAHMRAGTAPLFDMLQTRPAEWSLDGEDGAERLVAHEPGAIRTYVERYWKHHVGHDWYVTHGVNGIDSHVTRDTSSVNSSVREMMRGIATLVSAHEFDLFATHELVRLFAYRSIKSLTLAQMRAQTDFEAFTEQSDTLAHDVEYLEWFWSIVEGWNDDLRACLLQFVTADRDFARQVRGEHSCACFARTRFPPFHPTAFRSALVRFYDISHLADG